MTGPPEGTQGTEGESAGARSVPKGFTAPAPSAPPDPPEQKQSPLVGFMSVPVNSRLPIRRSTLLMVVAFIGLGTLLYFNPPQSTATGAVVHTPNGDFFVPGATKVDDSTTTTVPPTTTTTTRPVATTTTTGKPAATTAPMTVPPSTSTSTSTPTPPTSTVTGASTTTTSSRIQGTGTGTGSTTTTTP